MANKYIIMSDILRLDHVCQYNDMMGCTTLHPSVSVIDFSECQPVMPSQKYFGFYAVLLKDFKHGELKYGRHYYDYQEGTLVFFAPGQIGGIDNNGEPFQPKGWALLFDSELLQGTDLAHHMKDYSFFSYEADEALHLSESEREIVLDCLHKIKEELMHPIDRHSQTLIVNNIELLLNYCVRFYDHQFLIRSNANKDVLTHFESLLEDYFATSKSQHLGLPSVQYFADQLHLSPNYFGDLIKKETSKSAQEHIQTKLIDIAKNKVLDTSRTLNEIADELGFKYPQHFSRFFKEKVGCSPTEYRTMV